MPRNRISRTSTNWIAFAIIVGVLTAAYYPEKQVIVISAFLFIAICNVVTVVNIKQANDDD